MAMQFKELWNELHKENAPGKPVYDEWLDKYQDILESCSTAVLDLGCGNGNNTLYLREKRLPVIACDHSEVALQQVQQEIPDVETMLVDISERLPFDNDSFDVVIADLSLHYFDEYTTVQIMHEIKRVLRSGGHLFARVNSILDSNYGAGRGERLEDNYYFVDGYNKRFFSVEDAYRFFSIVGKVDVREADMLRYSKPKRVVEVKVEKG